MNEPVPQSEHATLRALRLGRLIEPLGTAARTDVGADGERHAYRSGTSIYSGHYDAVNGAWVYVQETP